MTCCPSPLEITLNVLCFSTKCWTSSEVVSLPIQSNLKAIEHWCVFLPKSKITAYLPTKAGSRQERRRAGFSEPVKGGAERDCLCVKAGVCKASLCLSDLHSSNFCCSLNPLIIIFRKRDVRRNGFGGKTDTVARSRHARASTT